MREGARGGETGPRRGREGGRCSRGWGRCGQDGAARMSARVCPCHVARVSRLSPLVSRFACRRRTCNPFFAFVGLVLALRGRHARQRVVVLLDRCRRRRRRGSSDSEAASCCRRRCRQRRRGWDGTRSDVGRVGEEGGQRWRHGSAGLGELGVELEGGEIVAARDEPCGDLLSGHRRRHAGSAVYRAREGTEREREGDGGLGRGRAGWRRGRLEERLS